MFGRGMLLVGAAEGSQSLVSLDGAGVKLLFFHQAARLVATVRPVVTRVSTWASWMGRTGGPVADRIWLVRARARQCGRWCRS